MLKDFLMLGSCGTASYAWLSAIVAPVVCAIRASIRERASRRALGALALAAGGAVLWTFLPAGPALLGLMLGARAGVMLLRGKGPPARGPPPGGGPGGGPPPPGARPP